MPSSDWQKVQSLGDVNNRYVGGIKNAEGIYMYARQAHSYGLGRFGASWDNNKFKRLMKTP